MVERHREPPVAEKGAPGAADAPAREWTDLSVEEERKLLLAQLACARDAHDEPEVKRIEARLRLLAGA
jgi:hypothetical protein